MFDSQIDAHIRALEPKPQRQAEKPKAAPGKYLGIVKRWSRFGYGFATPDQTIAELGDQSEIFVGAVQLRRSRIFHPLQHGDRISFDLKKSGDGRYEACNVSLLAA